MFFTCLPFACSIQKFSGEVMHTHTHTVCQLDLQCESTELSLVAIKLHYNIT